ncbi:MAG: hypothetical protein ACTHJR_12300 [Sphingomonas sp.]|uniref:hypothetical protein n=1 Tax=Sphingomonas sp. TaxID=28214 RepID=UPI003F7D99B0
MPFTKQDVVAGLARAADWLTKNPDRHIAGTLARDSYGDSCDPTNPNAQCFCALGRFANEMGVAVPLDTQNPNEEYEPLYSLIGRNAVRSIYRANDGDTLRDAEGRALRSTHCGGKLAGDEGINALKALATRLNYEQDVETEVKWAS